MIDLNLKERKRRINSKPNLRVISLYLFYSIDAIIDYVISFTFTRTVDLKPVPLTKKKKKNQ